MDTEGRQQWARIPLKVCINQVQSDFINTMPRIRAQSVSTAWMRGASLMFILHSYSPSTPRTSSPAPLIRAILYARAFVCTAITPILFSHSAQSRIEQRRSHRQRGSILLSGTFANSRETPHSLSSRTNPNPSTPTHSPRREMFSVR